MLALACSSIADPALDPGAESLVPPVVYRRWWTMVEECSGIAGSFDAVVWYSVPNSDVVHAGNDQIGGYWAPGSNRIVLAGNGLYDGRFIRHEMLHALVRQTKGHSHSYFVDQCGGIVSCVTKCREDVGPPPIIPSDIRRVQSSALRINVSLIPDEPDIETDGGVFTVAVTAINPNSYPVVVELDDRWLGRGFFYQIYGPGVVGVAESDSIFDSSTTYFKAGQQKLTYFDLSLTELPGASFIKPGLYALQGGYDTTSAILEQIRLGRQPD